MKLGETVVIASLQKIVILGLMQRFFVTQIEQEHAIFSPQQAHQISVVLRMQLGQQVIVLDNLGWEYDAQLVEVGRKRVTAVISNKRPVTNEPACELTLFQAMLKRDNFEWVLQKGTEIGVTRFVPVISERTVVKFKPNKITRWRKIITEAAEQSGRGRLPELTLPMSLDNAFMQIGASALAVMPWVGATGTTMRSVMANQETFPNSIGVFIGPEGGFSEDEVANGRSHSIIPITLGKRILRAETAAVVATALVLQEETLRV